MSYSRRTTSIWNSQKLDHFAAGMAPCTVNINAYWSHSQGFEIELFMTVKVKLKKTP
jgi:hypothetical protein